MDKLDSKVEEIKKRCLMWFGDVKRMRENRWLKKILNWRPQGG